MGKNGKEEKPMERGGRRSGADWPEFVTFVGLAAVLFVGAQNYMETKRIQTSLNDRLTALETRISALSTKVDQGARAAQPRPSGPDPNRVYNVKLDNAPYEGPKSAPVVIAEFSDFQ